MEINHVSKSVRRITVLRKDASGNTTPVAIYKRKSSKKKKGMKLLRPIEQATRQLVKAQSRTASKYLGRHRSSNGKRKDGWLRDLGLNMMRASRKGSKAIKINRLFSY
jgi:hypothetical protein